MSLSTSSPSSSSSSSTFSRHSGFCRLVLCILALPALLTYLHVTGLLRKYQFVLVQRLISDDTAGGIYRMSSKGKGSFAYEHYDRLWHTSQSRKCSIWNRHDDPLFCLSESTSLLSITQLLKWLARVAQEPVRDVSPYLLKWTDQAGWQLFADVPTSRKLDYLPLMAQSPSTHNPLILLATSEYNKHAPRQIWYYGEPRETFKTQSSASSLDNSAVGRLGFRRNPNRLRRSYHGFLWSFITKSPSTTLLIMVNVGLYWFYWHHAVDPLKVALNGNLLMGDFGRAFTGALAHFEVWHIGFNMMSLSSLGQDLEPLVGSIPFLLWNVSLIPLTTILLLALRSIHHTYMVANRQRQQHPQQELVNNPFPNIVGFSGVLFAWMVVASLNQQTTCPIPMFPDVCFDTYEIWDGIKVNVGPLAQLVFAQIILPRSCFVGHLAGIIAGFALHWNVLSLEWLQPCILLPVLWICGKTLLYYQNAQRSHDSLTGRELSRLTTSSNATPMSSPRSLLGSATLEGEESSSSSKMVEKRLQAMIRYKLLVLVVVFILGNFSWSLIVSQVILWMILIALHTVSLSGSSLGGTLGRGYIVFVLIVLLTDAMTLGGYLATRILWPQRIWILVGFVGMRLIWNLESLCLVSLYLEQSHQVSSTSSFLSSEGQVFVQLFGKTVIQPSASVLRFFLALGGGASKPSGSGLSYGRIALPFLCPSRNRSHFPHSSTASRHQRQMEDPSTPTKGIPVASTISASPQEHQQLGNDETITTSDIL